MDMQEVPGHLQPSVTLVVRVLLDLQEDMQVVKVQQARPEVLQVVGGQVIQVAP